MSVARTTQPSAVRRLAAGTTPLVKVTRKPAGAAADVWEGVGVNTNGAVYESKPGVAPTSAHAIAVGEQQIADLHPQVSRVYIHPNVLELQDPTLASRDPARFALAKQQLAAVKHLVAQATQSGGQVDLNLWSLHDGARSTPAEMKQATHRFAKLVKQLEAAAPNAPKGTFTVSVQNEPNRTHLTPPQLVQLYRDLDGSLKTTLGEAGRRNVKVIAGHLTWADHSDQWIKAVVPHLGGVVDGFSFHVYSRPDDTPQTLEAKLKGLRAEVAAALPKGVPVPELMLTEYGARGFRPAGDPKDEPGDTLVNGKAVPLRDTPLGAFREAQLVIAAARAGFSGAIRWGANPGGANAWTSWSMTGTRAEGFAKKPAWFVTRLFTAAVGKGWRAMLPSSQPAGESVASWRAPSGGGAAAVVANSKAGAQALTVAGFPPGSAVRVLEWNAHGGGGLASRRVTADARGEVRLAVAPHGVVAATTQLAHG